MWSMKDLLSEASEIDEPKVFTLPSPVYHWAGWDGHTGGVTAIHLDSWGLVAVNACKHQVIIFLSLTFFEFNPYFSISLHISYTVCNIYFQRSEISLDPLFRPCMSNICSNIIMYAIPVIWVARSLR